ncbi:alkaline phosphatase [Anopheles sinensis]|uniref:Alkaline phosphatase n=1 Tax=Anopheles sinensis TaxID=74873 RepID=A0A084W3E5_ANOSI|nr:alkaline phosphatase [Anopheles sinensis]
MRSFRTGFRFDSQIDRSSKPTRSESIAKKWVDLNSGRSDQVVNKIDQMDNLKGWGKQENVALREISPGMA